MDSRPRSGAAPATVTGEFRPFMPLDVIREGGAGTVTREPGDLPDAVVLCADGVCRAKRGYPSYDDAVGVAGEASAKPIASRPPVVFQGGAYAIFQISGLCDLLVFP